MRVSTDATAKGKFFARGGMLYVKGAFLAVQLNALWPHGALGQVRLGQVGHPLKVVVTRVAEVGRAEAEEDGHRAAVAALVLEIIGAVFGTHLSLRHVTAASANQLFSIVLVAAAGVGVAVGLASVVGFLTLEADVVGVALEGEAGWVAVKSGSLRRNCLAFGQAFVLQPHERLLLHVLVELVDWVEVLFQSFVIYARFADRAVSEPKSDPGTDPALFEDSGAAAVVEHVAALKQNGWNRGEGLSEAYHAHVVGVLFQLHARAAVKAGHALGLKVA